MQKARREPNIRVEMHQGGLSVVEKGRRRHLVALVTQHEAIEIARLIARGNGSELIGEGLEGRIRARDSHVSDPGPLRG